MLFEIGTRVSEELSKILRRNTTTADRVIISEAEGLSESIIKSVMFRQNPVTERNRLAMISLARLAFKNASDIRNQATDDQSHLIRFMEYKWLP